jgi:hypothetical protein
VVTPGKSKSWKCHRFAKKLFPSSNISY